VRHDPLSSMSSIHALHEKVSLVKAVNSAHIHAGGDVTT
jgi:hypothetical protein